MHYTLCNNIITDGDISYEVSQNQKTHYDEININIENNKFKLCSGVCPRMYRNSLFLFLNDELYICFYHYISDPKLVVYRTFSLKFTEYLSDICEGIRLNNISKCQNALSNIIYFLNNISPKIIFINNIFFDELLNINCPIQNKFKYEIMHSDHYDICLCYENIYLFLKYKKYVNYHEEIIFNKITIEFNDKYFDFNDYDNRFNHLNTITDELSDNDKANLDIIFTNIVNIIDKYNLSELSHSRTKSAKNINY